jgi:hypothetical protein
MKLRPDRRFAGLGAAVDREADRRAKRVATDGGGAGSMAAMVNGPGRAVGAATLRRPAYLIRQRNGADLQGSAS